MPASRFFAMLEASRILRNQSAVHACYQARAGTVSAEGFGEIVEFFNTLGMPKIRPPDVEVTSERRLKGEEARIAMMSVFGRDFRSNGSKKIPVH